MTNFLFTDSLIISDTPYCDTEMKNKLSNKTFRVPRPALDKSNLLIVLKKEHSTDEFVKCDYTKS